MVGASRIGKFDKSNFLREHDVDLLAFFYGFSQQSSSFVRSTAVRAATFRRDLFTLNSDHTISAITSLSPPPSSGLRVLFFVSCGISIYLSITWLASSCCWLLLLLYRCYTASHHICTSRLQVGGGGGPGHPTLWRVGARLAHRLHHH